MTIQYDTRIGNKTISLELQQLFSDLANHVNNTVETLEKVKDQARKEGFSDEETYYLCRKALSVVKSRGQLDYLFHGKSVIKKKGYVGSMKSCKRTVTIFQIFIYPIIEQLF